LKKGGIQALTLAETKDHIHVLTSSSRLLKKPEGDSPFYKEPKKPEKKALLVLTGPSKGGMRREKYK